MLNNELKISSKDWLNILIIGILFGFFQSLIFYFLNKDLQTISTIIFSISTAFFISGIFFSNSSNIKFFVNSLFFSYSSFDNSFQKRAYKKLYNR